MNKKTSMIGILITLLGGIFWGLSGACGQYLFENKEVVAKWLVPVRLLIAGGIMLSYFIIKDKKTALEVWKNRKNAVDIIIYGIAGMMLCQYTYFATIELSNAGTATVLQYVAPVLIMITICIKEKKRPKVNEIIAIICALSGVFLLATHGNINQLVISKETLFMGLASALTVVIYNIQPKNLMTQFSTPLLLAWAMLIGGGVLTIIFKPWIYTPIVDTDSIIALIVIIFLGTIASFSLYMEGVKLIGPTKASLYACIEPVAAAVLSTVWLKNTIGFIDVIGFVLIVSTIFILLYANSPKKNEESEAIKLESMKS